MAILLLRAAKSITPIITALVSNSQPGGPSLLATDASEWPPEYIDEATKVRLAPGTNRVLEIGKGLPAWDALDTGAFLLAPEAWQTVDAAPYDCELSVIFSELGAARFA